jgi:hypothetical protein
VEVPPAAAIQFLDNSSIASPHHPAKAEHLSHLERRLDPNELERVLDEAQLLSQALKPPAETRI